jgi:N-acetyl-anhydromuramyl-L-alanine amidase AmpD
MLGNFNRVRGQRLGIMLHYDDSTSDASGIQWLTKDPACHVSYNIAVQDDGVVVAVTPEDARAWHAGVCKSSGEKLVYTDANSAFYGIAITANAKDHATARQLAAMVDVCVRLFRKHRWPLTQTWRITTHAIEAWPRGRKVDCEGQDADGKLRTRNRVLDYEEVRRRVAAT